MKKKGDEKFGVRKSHFQS